MQLDVLSADIRKRPGGDQHQRQLIAARTFAAAMQGNQLGLQDYHFLFQPVQRGYQAAKLGRVGGTGPRSTSALWGARYSVKHATEVTRLLVRIDHVQGGAQRCHLAMARTARSRASRAASLASYVAGEAVIDRLPQQADQTAIDVVACRLSARAAVIVTVSPGASSSSRASGPPSDVISRRGTREPAVAGDPEKGLSVPAGPPSSRRA